MQDTVLEGVGQDIVEKDLVHAERLGGTDRRPSPPLHANHVKVTGVDLLEQRVGLQRQHRHVGQLKNAHEESEEDEEREGLGVAFQPEFHETRHDEHTEAVSVTVAAACSMWPAASKRPKKAGSSIAYPTQSTFRVSITDWMMPASGDWCRGDKASKVTSTCSPTDPRYNKGGKEGGGFVS